MVRLHKIDDLRDRYRLSSIAGFVCNIKIIGSVIGFLVSFHYGHSIFAFIFACTTTASFILGRHYAYRVRSLGKEIDTLIQ